MLKQKASGHTRPGEIVALAAHGLNDEDHHVSHCKDCNRIYVTIQNFLITQLDPDKELPCDCPGSKEDTAKFIALFLRHGLPQEQVTPFFAHINNCYPCFEILFTEWNAYLQQVNRSNGGGEGNDDN